MPRAAQLVLLFWPERMGEAERFAMFYSGTYSFSARDKRAVGGAINHFVKAHRLFLLAKKLIPNLDLDDAQMEERGSTPADNASELATVLEASFLELYSSLDCVVKTLFAIYHPKASDKQKSTRRFFQNPDPTRTKMPPEVVAMMADTGWYKRLLSMRDELTHLATGSVHRDRETKLIRYFHSGLTEADKPLIIDDVFEWLEQTLRTVDAWVGRVFQFLNTTLSDAEVDAPCGVVEGRFLMRKVSGKPPVTFHSGRCMSAQWFDLPENPTCPWAEGCGAYLNRTATGGGGP